jgi:hypothetical protein
VKGKTYVVNGRDVILIGIPVKAFDYAWALYKLNVFNAWPKEDEVLMYVQQFGTGAAMVSRSTREEAERACQAYASQWVKIPGNSSVARHGNGWWEHGGRFVTGFVEVVQDIPRRECAETV